jgi:hypothetical protein
VIRRHWRGLLALVCLAGASFLALLAAELVRWQHQVSRDDRLFQVTPARGGLWQVPHAPSVDPSTWILGLEDDLAYRRALQLFWYGKPTLTYKPNQAADSVRAQVTLARLATADPSPKRRASALNLLGYLLLAGPGTQDIKLRMAHLTEGISDFRDAIALDPDAVDAKLNLELALRAQQEVLDEFVGHGATAGIGARAGGGLGLVGSGY